MKLFFYLAALTIFGMNMVTGQDRLFENLPEEFEVHSIGINRGPVFTDVVLDDTRRLASEATVVVNKPGTPVVLVLSSASAVVWKVGRTRGSEIAGVIVTGTQSQALIGIEEEVPYAISTLVQTGDFGSFVIDDDRIRLLEAEAIIENLLGRGTTLLQLYPETDVYHVGEPVDPAEVIHSDFLKLEDYLDPSHPPGRKPSDAFTEKLLQEGKVRPATQEDAEAWLDAASEPYAKFNNPALRVDFTVEPLVNPEDFPVFVILEEFEFDPDEYEPIIASFLFSEEVALPQSFLQSALWLFRTDGASVGLLNRVREDPSLGELIFGELEEPPDDTALEPFFADLPEDFRLYAVDTYETPFQRPELRIDDESGLVTQADVIVNEPNGTPVVLVLTGHDSIVWNVGLTEGTRLALVIVSGRSGATLIGVPDGVASINSTFLVPGDFQPFEPEGATRKLLTMNARLKALGGRDIDQFYFDPWDASTGLFHVGQPLTENQRVIYSEDRTVDEFVLPNTPLYGRAGIEKLVSEGKMRLATQADINAWIALETEGLPEFAEGAGWRNPWLHEGAAYVILEQITFPSGMGGSGILAYIVPERVPPPKGNPHFAQVYYIGERLEDTRERFVLDFEAWARDLEEKLGEGAKVTAQSDSDHDGMGDRIEFLVGSDPLDPTSVHFLEAGVERGENGTFAILNIPIRTNDSGIELTLEGSDDGLLWGKAEEEFSFVKREAINAWTDRVRFRSVKPIGNAGVRLYRLRTL